MSRVAILNVVGLSARHLGEHTPRLAKFAASQRVGRVRPQLPAVTCTMQATYLTGKRPTEHGIVGNGWYDRQLAEHHFWKQSNHLVTAPKLWEVIRQQCPSFTCAKLFWWYNMYSTADWSITPRPTYPADGSKVFDIYTSPMELRDAVKADLGEFPFPAFWGPLAGIGSARWIADAARWIETHHQPDLSLIYLPHLDYDLQRFGPDSPQAVSQFKAIDDLAGDLIETLQHKGVHVVVLSEYGITPVERSISINRLFRQHGWLTLKNELGLERLDCGASQAFAIADHQVAHIYLNDLSIMPSVRSLLEQTDGVAQVIGPDERAAAGLDHTRAGDLIVIAQPDCWFDYYYWDDPKKAPDFARCVDIHRKYGYDPVELFLDPALTFPRLTVALKLLRKKLGFRGLMDVIPLDSSLVRGSHGAVPADSADWPLLIGPWDELPKEMAATDVFGHLLKACGVNS